MTPAQKQGYIEGAKEPILPDQQKIMIHTFELIKILSNKDYYKLTNNAIYDKSQDLYHYDEYKDKGISLKLYRQSESTKGILKAKINLSKICDPANPLHLITAEELQKIIEDREIEKLLFQTISSLNHSRRYAKLGNLESFRRMSGVDLSEFNLNRVDYAVQVEDLQPDVVALYIHLCNKGDLSRYDHHNKFPDSCYQTNNSVHINIYNKVAEQMKKNQDLPNDRSDILRIEIQCLKEKLESMSKTKELSQYELSRDQPQTFLSSEVSRWVISHYLRSLICAGDHAQLKAALDKISQSKLTKSKKEALEALLKAESKPNTTLDAVKEKLYKGNGRLYRSHLETLAELNINPITIPKHSKIKYLPNLEKIAIPPIR